MKPRNRRRPSTRSARQCASAATSASTENTSGTKRCRPNSARASPAGAIQHKAGDGQFRLQFSALRPATAAQAPRCSGRSTKSSSNKACTNTQNSTALATDTAMNGVCHSAGTPASNAGVALITCRHRPSSKAWPTRAAAKPGRSRPSTAASNSSSASSMPRKAASSRGRVEA